jgi:FkbM family methyltransferase
MLKSLFRRSRRATAAETAIVAAFDRIEARLGRIERASARLRTDVDHIRKYSGLILGPTRALAVLATGQRLYVDPRDRGCGINLLTDGKLDEVEFDLFRRHLGPGSVFLDIGANYGLHAIRATPYMRPGGRVIGFEPNPHVCGLLRDSIYLNGLTGMVEVHQVGVHDTNGTLRFLADEQSPGGSHIVSADVVASERGSVIEVPVVRLDDYLPSDLIVDAVKIDVEGQEEAVLRGMRRLIERSPDIIVVMELGYGFFPSEAALEAFLHFIREDLGLIIQRIGHDGRLTPVTVEGLRGTICNLLLARPGWTPAADLTITAAQMLRDNGAELVGDALRWRRDPAETVRGGIALGPYVYLPQGMYRLRIDGEFDGRFICSVQENFGQLIADHVVPAGQGFEAIVHIPLDAPAFEVAFWPADAEASGLRLRKIEMSKIG